MTACEKMFLLLDKLLEQRKSLDEIGEYICDGVEHPRLKAIRLIKTRKGEQYLKDNAEWLGYSLPFELPIEQSKDKQKCHGLDSSQPQPQPLKLSPSGYIIPDNIPQQKIHNNEKSNSDCFGNDNFCVSKPVPLKDKLNYCPCGCGYGYLIFGDKWYSPEELNKL